MTRALLLVAVVAVALPSVAGCGSDPVDAAGTYTISLTNRENGCNNPNWTVGEMTSGIGVVVTQNGVAVTADVQPGAARLALDLALGSHLFTGVVDGDRLDLLITGTPMYSQGTCDYTIDAQIDARLDGDVLSGDVFYRARTDGATDCGTLTGCASRQELLGNRPPS
ncbi:MAG: hypothetical protein HS111_08030 [Kofleriaceae bacterium]|nr:hypothetical protein [Kofleriaceae bacterium]MCL4224740.1 hypothetical protein [Myxococcales bacterium]